VRLAPPELTVRQLETPRRAAEFARLMSAPPCTQTSVKAVFAQYLDTARSQEAGARSLFDVLTTAPLEDHSADPGGLQDITEDKARGTCAENQDIGCATASPNAHANEA
jgi:hypothetical protein